MAEDGGYVGSSSSSEGEDEGGDPGDVEMDDIECSSSDGDSTGPWPHSRAHPAQRGGTGAAATAMARLPAGRLPLQQQRRGQGQSAQQHPQQRQQRQQQLQESGKGKKAQAEITSFLQKVLPGVPSSTPVLPTQAPRQQQQQQAQQQDGLSLLQHQHHIQQQQQQAGNPQQQPGPGDAPPLHRPGTAEEAQLDLLDYANRLVFGNGAFRPQQREVVEAAMRGLDCFVLMPTGQCCVVLCERGCGGLASPTTQASVLTSCIAG